VVGADPYCARPVGEDGVDVDGAFVIRDVDRFKRLSLECAGRTTEDSLGRAYPQGSVGGTQESGHRRGVDRESSRVDRSDVSKVSGDWIEMVETGATSYPKTSAAVVRDGLNVDWDDRIGAAGVTDKSVVFAVVAGETTRTCAYPELSRWVGMQNHCQVVGKRLGNAKLGLIRGEAVSIPPRQTRLGADPEKAVAVLCEARDHRTGEAVALREMFKEGIACETGWDRWRGVRGNAGCRRGGFSVNRRRGDEAEST